MRKLSKLDIKPTHHYFTPFGINKMLSRRNYVDVDTQIRATMSYLKMANFTASVMVALKSKNIQNYTLKLMTKLLKSVQSQITRTYL